MNSNSQLTSIEQEVIILMAVWGMIDSMANYAMFNIAGNDPNSEIRFETSIHQKLFNVLLVDFLSQPPKGNFNLPSAANNPSATDKTYLYYLKSVYTSPCFMNCPVERLKDATEQLVAWLEQDCTFDGVWFPSINIEAKLTIKRIEFIKICGNISKHNFTRLDRDAASLKAIMERNTTTEGAKIKLGKFDEFLALPEFYQWFHVDIFSYHSSAIAEFLNNIRWGIYQYLKPEFDRSIVFDSDNSIGYSYTHPNGLQNPFARNTYCELMNEVRGKPYMRQFEVTRFLKMRY